MRKFVLPAVFAVVTVALDFWTKALILARFEFGEYLPVTPYFNLVHVHNTGAAFGLLSGAHADLRIPFFVVVSLIAFGVISTLVYKAAADKLVYVSALGLILGGAVGNFIDRIRFGFVVDFLDFHLGASHWPAFNVADIAISVGVGLLLLDMIQEERKQKKETRPT